MGRRGRRKGSQGRAQSRVRERVRGGGARGGGERGSGGRGGGESTSRKRGGFDVGAIEDYAGRLTNRTGGGSGFSGAAPGLTGAAAGLAGGGLADRFLGGGSEGSDEDFRKEVADQFALVEERLQLLEDQMQELREVLGGAEASADPEVETEPGSGADPGSTQ